MYLSHFGLAEPPFTITPHTEFFYGGANRGATLEALIYAITHGEGLIKVAGEVGSGKTMLCRVLMERLPAHVETIYLANPSLSRDEILYAIADDLKLDVAGSRATVVLRALRDALIEKHAAGKRVVALIDEAHAMPADTLEEIRLLSNLDTSRNKLLQIVLFGQPELDAHLGLPQMRQLKERIVHNFTMQPLPAPVIEDYLMFRMRAAGYRGPDIFTSGAIRLISKASDGLTRRVNILADKALLAAFVENTHAVEARHVKSAIRDSEFKSRPAWLTSKGAVAAASLLAGLALGWVWHFVSAFTAPADTSPRPESRSESDNGAGNVLAVQPSSGAGHGATASGDEKPGPPGGGANQPPAAGPGVFPDIDPGTHKLLKQRIEAAKSMLASRAGEQVSIQLFLTDDVRPARIEGFLMRASKQVNLSDIYVWPTRSGGQMNLRVLYGVYPSREAATAAMSKLPAKWKAEFPLKLRPLREILQAG